MNITNEQFLRAIFGDQYVYAHVTSFPDDPGNIPHDRKGICWAGGYLKDTQLQPDTNQFYTVSLFAPDDKKSKRRKANFSAQHVIMLDDVKEKLPLSEVNKLPPPSIVLQSSLHSEQWLYVLATPCTDRTRLDNLTDQLITNGLAPNTKDPGMKGVTRYGRLPEGVNTKASRIAENGGTPPRCQITEWHPERKYTLEQLAEPFNVNLDAPRREARTDGATEIPDHPVLNKITVKSILSPGRYDITCPWVEEHTGEDDSGTAVFTNDDGTIGFQCHHGSHQDKKAGDLLNWIEEVSPGFKAEFKQWQIARQFGDVGADRVEVNCPKGMQDLITELIGLPAELMNIKKTFNSTFFNPINSTYNFFNKEGNIVKFSQSNAAAALTQVSGLWWKDNASEDQIKKIIGKVLLHLKLNQQKDKINYSVDMFTNKSVMAINDSSVDVTLFHKPFKIHNPVNQIIVNDFNQHFTQFEQFIDVLCAARFASDRREAFIWFHACSNFGKGFLMAVLAQLGISTEMSVKEVERSFEGNPIGRTATDFTQSWILIVDEMKYVRSEIKQLNNTITGSPKNQLVFQAPLYTKLFISAETIESLAGSEGVEDQFGNRIGYMKGKGDLDKRQMFTKSKSVYRDAICDHVASRINDFVDEMRSVGRQEAANRSDEVLSSFNKQHSITKYFGSLDDSVEAHVDDMKKTLINYAQNKTGFNAPKEIYQHLMQNITVEDHARYGKVLLLTSAVKFVKLWLAEKVDESQKKSLQMKARIICDLLDIEGKSTHPKRLGEKLKKGVMIQLMSFL